MGLDSIFLILRPFSPLLLFAYKVNMADIQEF